LEDFPVVLVSWSDAVQYCRVQRKRLPTEDEWEKTFRGNEGRKYPWVNSHFISDYARTFESGDRFSLIVSSQTKDISVYGALHMAGNVREWVSDDLKPYPGSFVPASEIEQKQKVIRGGSWATSIKSAVGWQRSGSLGIYGWKDVGFRCAK
jgi:formylglycine-generating enzyme required for sulfatase activity